ncbi:hypothetical protein DXI23_12205 [Marinobacter flavimaris]|jgi:hypothetical protein|uniref:Uncharacterized protein n=2 Tax=Marinobacter TaxID=2742 RepID=A0A3D8H1E6_9GAMM|nr:hypothetical protein MDHKLMBL_11535 [Marinobacter flavimaris]RDU40533.1 hypothetical protein DXI23_12205 [Marinobacter flavimaris]HBC33269.1 hypothetical protein [Marinobacter adhaerens]
MFLKGFLFFNRKSTGPGTVETVSGMKQGGQTKRRIRTFYRVVSDTYVKFAVSEKQNPALGGVLGIEANPRARFDNI